VDSPAPIFCAACTSMSENPYWVLPQAQRKRRLTILSSVD
jgi:hypothetical protein